MTDEKPGKKPGKKTGKTADKKTDTATGKPEDKAAFRFRVLAINPGSTSTKIGVFDDEITNSEEVIRHSELDLANFTKIWDQYEFRKRTILDALREHEIDIRSLSAVVGRGGLLRPVVSGTYEVNKTMLDDCRSGVQGQHVANLGPVLAFGIGWDCGIPAYMVDPPSVDEFEPLARLSGHKDMPRHSLLHALNIRATAITAAEKLGKRLEDLNLIVAHLGGGISVVPLKRGRMIDVNDGNSGGPFSPERAGTVPTMELIDFIYNRDLSREDAKRELVGKGGLMSYLGVNDAQEVEDMIAKGNAEARLVYEAMAYQIAKEVGAMATVLKGDVDAIILTGGLSGSKMLTDWIVERVKFIAEVQLDPGEDELRALLLGCLRVLRGVEKPKTYPESVDTMPL
jgi:butyrate kinase